MTQPAAAGWYESSAVIGPCLISNSGVTAGLPGLCCRHPLEWGLGLRVLLECGLLAVVCSHPCTRCARCLARRLRAWANKSVPRPACFMQGYMEGQGLKQQAISNAQEEGLDCRHTC